VILGLTTIFSVSYSGAEANFLNFRKQILFAAIGFVAMFLVASTDYRTIKNYTGPSFAIGDVLRGYLYQDSGYIYTVTDPANKDAVGPVWTQQGGLRYWQSDVACLRNGLSSDNVVYNFQNTDNNGEKDGATAHTYSDYDKNANIYINHPQIIHAIFPHAFSYGNIGAKVFRETGLFTRSFSGFDFISLSSFQFGTLNYSNEYFLMYPNSNIELRGNSKKILIDPNSLPVACYGSRYDILYVRKDVLSVLTYEVQKVQAGFWSIVSTDGVPLQNSPDMDAYYSPNAPNSTTKTSGQFYLDRYTRREFSFYNGGTFRPQAWCNPSGEVVFSYGSAEDANGNRTTNLVRLDLTTGTETSIDSGMCFIAHCNHGSKVYYTKSSVDSSDFWTTVMYDCAYDGSSKVTYGSVGRGYLPVRLQGQGTGALWLFGKKYDSYDAWAHTGFVGDVNLAGSFVEKPLISLPGVSKSGVSGAFPIDATSEKIHGVGTAIAPDAVYIGVANANPTSGILWKINSASSLGVFKSTSYQSGNISSPLIFSKSTADTMWADRLYMGFDGDYATVAQLGVIGDWALTGYFESGAHNLGSITAFADFVASYFAGSGTVKFSFRNAATAVALASTPYKTITPGDALTAFPSSKPYCQWRVDPLLGKGEHAAGEVFILEHEQVGRADQRCRIGQTRFNPLLQVLQLLFGRGDGSLQVVGSECRVVVPVAVAVVSAGVIKDKQVADGNSRRGAASLDHGR